MTRVLSAVVLIAIIVVALWWLPHWATLTLAVLVAAVAGHELSILAGEEGPLAWIVALIAASAVVAFPMAATGVRLEMDALAIALLTGLLAGAFVSLASHRAESGTIARVAVLGLAPVYVGIPLGAAAAIHTWLGPNALGWLLLVIAGSDTAQYYTGRLFGRRKLAPALSPGKTIEGAIGGLIAAIAIGIAAGGWGLPGIPILTAGVAALIFAVVGMAGDLFESLLKRSAGVKDASQLIPGHGGVLDRIDAYLLALPAFYLFLRFIA